jgi:hypothetical protein
MENLRDTGVWIPYLLKTFRDQVELRTSIFPFRYMGYACGKPLLTWRLGEVVRVPCNDGYIHNCLLIHSYLPFQYSVTSDFHVLRTRYQTGFD